MADKEMQFWLDGQPFVADGDGEMQFWLDGQPFVALDAPALVTLTVADVALGTTADSISLVQQNTLSVDDVALATSADSISLVQQNTLSVDDVALGTSADSISLVQQNTLSVDDVALVTSVDSISLVQQNTLSVDDVAVSTTFGSHASWNPADKYTAITLSGGDLTATWAVPIGHVRATVAKTTGKWYWEITIGSNTNVLIGVAKSSEALNLLPGEGPNSWAYYGANGNKFTNNVGTAYGVAAAANDVIGIALDMDNGKLFFSKNGVWQNSGDPVAGTGFAFGSLTGALYPAAGYAAFGASLTVNFGASPFAYTPPVDFRNFFEINLAQANVLVVDDVAVGLLADSISLVQQNTLSVDDVTIALMIGVTAVTWNPADKDANVILSNGDLTQKENINDTGSVRASFSVTSGKWYWESTHISPFGLGVVTGIARAAHPLTKMPGFDAESWGLATNGSVYHNSAFVYSTGVNILNGHTVGVAFDLVAGKVWFSKNGTWLNGADGFSGDPANGLHPCISGVTGTIFPCDGEDYTNHGTIANFGATPFAFASPSGFASFSDLSNLTLVQQNALSVNDFTVDLSIENVALALQYSLAVFDSSITSAIDSVALIQRNIIAVNNIALATNIESVSLFQQNILSINDSLFDLIFDSPELTQQNTLSVNDFTVLFRIDNVGKKYRNILGIVLSQSRFAGLAKSQSKYASNVLSQSRLAGDVLSQSKFDGSVKSQIKFNLDNSDDKTT